MKLAAAGLLAMLVGGALSESSCQIPGASEPAALAEDPGSEPPATAAEASASGDEPLVLVPPPLPPPAESGTADPGTAHEEPVETEARTALAYQFNSPVYERPGSDRIVGFVRRGTEVPIARWVPGPHCEGSWYELMTGGYVCNTDGFDTRRGDKALPPEIEIASARTDDPLPFAYAKVVTPDAPIFWRLPSPDEEAQARAEPTSTTGPVKERAAGAVFVAISRWVDEDGRRFVRTPRGMYLAADDVEVRQPPKMVGEALQSAEDLPLAFVHVDLAPILEAQTLEPLGTALKHARFAVHDHLKRDESSFVVGPDDIAVPAGAVRVVEASPRPDRVPAGAQWVHVDIGRQTLVAYEGDDPVRATLISSGKEGYEPPLGVFRVHKKYVTKTMSGDDEVDGSYEVGQVPWTMYYWGSLALHGAYWHDGFGVPRSHGCTNIPPVDARWLFQWAEPQLPGGWYAGIGVDGPWVVVTRSDGEG